MWGLGNYVEKVKEYLKILDREKDERAQKRKEEEEERIRNSNLRPTIEEEEKEPPKEESPPRDMFGNITTKTQSTRFSSLSSRDIKMMTKRQLINVYKTEYELASVELRKKFESEAVKILTFHKDKAKRQKKIDPSVTRETIIAQLQAMSHGRDVPKHVLDKLDTISRKQLVKLAFKAGLHVPKMHHSRVKPALIELYRQNPHLYLKEELFKMLSNSEEAEKKERPKKTIFSIQNKTDKVSKSESKVEEKEEPLDIEELKKTNLKKYQAMVLKYVDKETDFSIRQKLDISYLTLKNWIAKFEKYGDVTKKLQVPGRTNVITDDIKEYIKDEYKYDPVVTVKDIRRGIKDNFNKSVSLPTIYNYLKTIGKFIRPKEYVALNRLDKERRTIYCTKMSTRSFKNIVFTDESKIEIRRNKRKIFRMKNQKLVKRYLPSKISIMVFGAISMQGKIFFKIVEPKKTVDSEYYCTRILSSLFEQVKTKHKVWTLMQDNARAHTAKNTMDFIKENKVKTLKHPPNSADLNPIEQIWSILKRKIEELNPRTIYDLRHYAQVSWDKIDDNAIRNCIKKLRKTMIKVISVGGDNVFPDEPNKRKLEKVNYAEENTPNEDNNDTVYYYRSDELKKKRGYTSKIKKIDIIIEDIDSKLTGDKGLSENERNELLSEKKSFVELRKNYTTRLERAFNCDYSNLLKHKRKKIRMKKSI